MEQTNKEIKAQIRATRIFKEIMNIPLSLEDIVANVHLHKPTVYNILKKLMKAGFVEELPMRSKSGKAMFVYAAKNASQFDFTYEKLTEKDYEDIPQHLMEAIKNKQVSPDVIRIHRSTDVKVHQPRRKPKHSTVNMQSSMEFIWY